MFPARDNGGWGSLRWGAGWPAGSEGGGWGSAIPANRSHLAGDGWGQPRETSWGGAGWLAGFERGSGWGQIPRRPEEEIEE